MSTSRRMRPVLPAAVVLALLVWPVPVQAADEIGLSIDGVAWAPQLMLPLFDPSTVWVPGGTETRSFELRNQGPSAASLTLEALSQGGDAVLAADVGVSVRVDGGAWTPVELGSTPRATTARPIQAGADVSVDVRVVLDPASGSATQDRVMPLSLRVTLVGDASGGDDPDAIQDHEGVLPGTGTTLTADRLLAALTLCAAGLVLIVCRRSQVARADRGTS